MSSFLVPSTAYPHPAAGATPASEPALTPEQAAVTRARAHAVVVSAGAGTGKTFTLAARVRHLVREAGVPEHRVLVITFTREATESLRRRIRLLLGRDHQVDVRSFHSFAARSLPRGERRFLDPRDARPLVARAARAAFARDPRGAALERILRAGALDRESLEDRLLAFWSYCKNCEVSARQAVEGQFTTYRGFEDLLMEAGAEYEALKGECLDFDDLLLRFRHRLRSQDGFREEAAGRLDHLLVDEYQDVNGVQHEIVRLLTEPVRGKRRPRVTIVGDARQSVYGFRGGAPDRFHRFLDAYPPGRRRLLHLSWNFRSQTRILEHANRILPEDGAPLRAAVRHRKEAPPRVLALEDADGEARFVCDAIEDLLASGEDPAEIAVLARARHLLKSLDEEVATRLQRAARFAKRPSLSLQAAEWLIAFSRFVNPAYKLEAASKAVLGRTLSPLVDRAADVPRFVDEAIAVKARQVRGERVSAPPGPPEAWRAFVQLREARAHLAPAFAGAFPAEAVLARGHALPFRDERLREGVAEIARRTERSLPGSAAAFETAVAGALGPDAVVESLGRVSRTTIHAAKGLEWDHVFLVGAHEGGLPGEPALVAEKEETKARLIAEERRLFYVAATRPRRSFTVTRPGMKGKRPLEPSRFLADYGF